MVPWGFGLANNLVFKRVRAALGLDRCKIYLTGAAPITKDTLEYFMSLNIPLMEIYGMSESSGPHTVSSNEEYRITRSADKHYHKPSFTGIIYFYYYCQCVKNKTAVYFFVTVTNHYLLMNHENTC